MRRLAPLLALFVACSEPPLVAPNEPTSSAPTAAATAAPASSAAPSASAAAPVEPVARPTPPEPAIRLKTGGGVVGEAGSVTSVEPNATRAGAAILEKGGNAVDAAVAVAFALAVTHPSAGNLGGGGFMVVRMADGRSTAIDFRETAAATSTTKKVLDEIAAGAIGWPSTVVPGTVAGLAYARDKLGTKPLAELVAPAVKLAKKHELQPRAAQSLAAQWDKLKKDPAAKKIFGKGNQPLRAGDDLVQRDLAKTIEAIGKDGPSAFYAGKVADAFETAAKKGGGDVTKADLASYVVKERVPITFTFRGFTVETMPPPSMGGVAVAQILMGLERERMQGRAPEVGTATWHHLFVENARRAYAERRLVGADPDRPSGGAAGPEPAKELARLLSPEHLARDWPAIEPAKATPSASIGKKSDAAAPESPETTHFSVVDAQGNAVSCTVTLSASFGAKVVVPGTGVLLSNALGAFSETGPNAVAPHKRMASSMSPTILSRGGKALAVVGSPGGDTIPGVVAQVVRNLVDGGMDVAAAGKAGRLHHQWLPDRIRTEKGTPLAKKTRGELEAMGHAVDESFIPLGDAKLIVVDDGSPRSWAFADDREGGLAVGVKAVAPR
jgi:gamma-glutamyltranspeptidase/glutathione hydrolase